MIKKLATALVLKVLRGQVTLEQVRYKYCGGNYAVYLEWYHTYWEPVSKLKQDADELNRKFALANAQYRRIRTLQKSFEQIRNDINQVIKNTEDTLLDSYSSNVKENFSKGDYFSRVNINATFSTVDWPNCTWQQKAMFLYKHHMAMAGVQEDVELINQHEQYISAQKTALQNEADAYQLFVLLGIF